MSRALPLVLAGVIATGTAGAALLPDSTPAHAAQVSAQSQTAITPVSPVDWTAAGMYAGRAVAQRKAAAARAAAQAAAAERARKARALAAERRASRSRMTPASYGSPKAIAQQQLAARGWSDQWSCLDSLWEKESGWSVYNSNPSSGAYGIPQALPGSKMASAGSDWRTNPATQIRWGLGYIGDRYGSPCAAWSHSKAHNWY